MEMDSRPTPRLLDQVRDKIRRMHYSLRTEQAYLDWIKRFILFNGKRHPVDLGAGEVEEPGQERASVSVSQCVGRGTPLARQG